MNILFTTQTTVGTAFLTYQFKVALILVCFFLFYRLLMSKETFHKLNRCLLTSMLMVSFILPFCVFTIHRYVPADVLAAKTAGDTEIVSGMVPSVPTLEDMPEMWSNVPETAMAAKAADATMADARRVWIFMAESIHHLASAFNDLHDAAWMCYTVRRWRKE